LATFRKASSAGFLFSPDSILIIVLLATSANLAERSCEKGLYFNSTSEKTKSQNCITSPEQGLFDGVQEEEYRIAERENPTTPFVNFTVGIGKRLILIQKL